MLVRSLWSLVQGYVIIRAKGRRLEAFINRAVRDGIPLWRIERGSDHLLVARVGASDFGRLARGGRGVGVRVDAVRKSGLPFWLAWARRRRALVSGGVLFVALLYGLAQFIWFVQVDGAQAIAPGTILKVAAEAGLRPGAARDGLHREDIERRLYLELPGIAWTSVELRGALATVRVVERTAADPILGQVGHVVAIRDGIVEKVSVTMGHALVAPGDTVQAGAPLISGMLAPGTPDFEERAAVGLLPMVRASGVVWGRAWYRGYGEARPEPDEPAAAGGDVLQERAVMMARAQALEHLPADAEIVDEEIVVVRDPDLDPSVVRAAVTVTVVQNLGRFSPFSADGHLGGVRPKDETDG